LIKTRTMRSTLLSVGIAASLVAFTGIATAGTQSPEVPKKLTQPSEADKTPVDQLAEAPSTSDVDSMLDAMLFRLLLDVPGFDSARAESPAVNRAGLFGWLKKLMWWIVCKITGGNWPCFPRIPVIEAVPPPTVHQEPTVQRAGFFFPMERLIWLVCCSIWKGPCCATVQSSPAPA
jgi:hypothetical protein